MMPRPRPSRNRPCVQVMSLAAKPLMPIACRGARVVIGRVVNNTAPPILTAARGRRRDIAGAPIGQAEAVHDASIPPRQPGVSTVRSRRSPP